MKAFSVSTSASISSKQAQPRSGRQRHPALLRPLAAMARAIAIPLDRIPRAGRVCFLIAFVNAAIWGVVVPPFQVPDEGSHVGYVQYLAQTGKPPPGGAGTPWSPEEELALERLYVPSVAGFSAQRGVLTASENRELHQALARKLNPLGGGGSSNSASNQPPLYYALEAIPYWLSPSHELLTRLAFMRLLSALLAGLTVLTIFMFMRELFPRTRWTWTVGALVVAFQPQFNFMAAGVNGDNLLYLASALTFMLLLRAYRRGFTTPRGAAVGAAVAVGVLSKITFLALLPGIALAVLMLTWRGLSTDRREALRALMVSVVVAAAPVALYAALNATAWHRGGLTAGGLAATNSHLSNGTIVTWHQTLDYIWQLYLPRLPFMKHSYFPNYQLTNLWFNGTIGHFGWLDYTFPLWVYKSAQYLFATFAVLAAVGLWRLRGAIRQLLPIFACFAVMAIGLMAAIGYTGVRYQLSSGEQFAQARYLFPLLVFYSLFLTLAARGLPRRWAHVFGALLVLLAMAHGLFAETLTISRYYG